MSRCDTRFSYVVDWDFKPCVVRLYYFPPSVFIRKWNNLFLLSCSINFFISFFSSFLTTSRYRYVEYIVDIFVFFLMFYLCTYLLSFNNIYIWELECYLFMTIMCLFASGQQSFLCWKTSFLRLDLWKYCGIFRSF